MSLIHLATLRGVGPCSTAALFVQPFQQKNGPTKTSKGWLFHCFSNTCFLQYCTKHPYLMRETSSGINTIWPKRSLPRTNPAFDPWWCMRHHGKSPAVARLEGLKVQNPWTKNDIFNLAPLCPLLMKLCYSPTVSDLRYFHVTSWAQKMLKSNRFAYDLQSIFAHHPPADQGPIGPFADKLTTGFFGSKYGPNTMRHGETWRQHVSLPLWIRSFGTCIFDGFYDWFGIAHIWLTLIFGLILV